jgi:hypothetical protein
MREERKEKIMEKLVVNSEKEGGKALNEEGKALNEEGKALKDGGKGENGGKREERSGRGRIPALEGEPERPSSEENGRKLFFLRKNFI